MTFTADYNSEAEERIAKQLADNGGFATVTLNDLKEVVGVKRLGKYVLNEIQTWLRREGLSYFPKSVLDENDTPRQDQQLRIYRDERSSSLAKTIAAILDPSPAGDRHLGTLAKGTSSQKAQELENRIEQARAALEDALRELTPVPVSPAS